MSKKFELFLKLKLHLNRYILKEKINKRYLNNFKKIWKVLLKVMFNFV